LSCSVWFSVPSFWMDGGLESRCVGRVYGADGAVHHSHRTHRTHVPETCRAKNTSIKLSCSIKLPFHIISTNFHFTISTKYVHCFPLVRVSRALPPTSVFSFLIIHPHTSLEIFTLLVTSRHTNSSHNFLNE